MTIDKKYTIVAIIVFLMIIAFIFFYLKTNVEQQTFSSQKTEGVAVPLPTQQTKDASNEDIKAGIAEEKINQSEETNKDYSEALLKEEGGQNISLKNYIDSKGVHMNSEVYGELEQSGFRNFNCCADKEKCGNGIIFTVKQDGNGRDLVGRYQRFENGLKIWEASFLKDLKNLFFENAEIDFASIPQFQSAKFVTENGANTIEIRYINFMDAEKNNLSINYAFFDNQLFISDDKNCMRSALNEYEDVLEP
jgi:hypothetical protein